MNKYYKYYKYIEYFRSGVAWILCVLIGSVMASIVTMSLAMMKIEDHMSSMDESLKRIAHVMVSHE